MDGRLSCGGDAEQEDDRDKDEKICVNHCDDARYVLKILFGPTIVPIPGPSKVDYPFRRILGQLNGGRAR